MSIDASPSAGRSAPLARHFLVQSSLTGISRIFGLVRDTVIAARIGSGPIGDAWFTALQFPNLFRRILAEGAFSQAFVPIYTHTLEKDGQTAAQETAAETLSVLFTATVAISIVAQLAMPWIMLVLQAGYRNNTEIFSLSILLTQITMPYLTGMALSALFAGMLNAAGRFTLSAIAPTIFNLCVIAAALSFDDPTQCALAASVAVLVSGFGQAGLLWIGLRRRNIRLALRPPKWTAKVRKLIALAVPGAIAASASQINILVSQSLASLEEGAKSWLAYADRLYQLPLGLIGVAIGVAILPRLSRSQGQSDHDGVAALDQALCLSLALILPAAAALMTMPTLLIEAIFARGAFTSADAKLAGAALFHFAWGAPAFVLVKVLAPAFFARQDTRRPMRFALLSVAFNLLAGATAFFWLRSHGHPGFVGLAAATSAAAWINTAFLIASLVRRNLYRPSPWVYRRLLRAGLACGLMVSALHAAMAVETGGAWGAWGAWGAGGVATELRLAVLVGLGALVYTLCALGLRVVSRAEIISVLRNR